MKWNIKKGDKVVVIAGEDKGKKGRVTEILREKNRVIVEGVNVKTKHSKPTSQNPQGGIIKTEGGIHVSNVALESDGAPTRVGRKDVKGTTVRVSKKTGKNID
ncbi:MAG: 50S ribosomal protein L24 [Bacteroidetes bacterium]|nr:50S ribosomal protein L24 [Bacteroidota bacterium]